MRRLTGLLLLFCLSPAIAAPSVFHLQVWSGKHLLTSLALLEQERWCLVWNHSVAGFPVEDCFQLRDGQWMLDSSHQPDFAAGLGHIEGRGQLLSDGEGGYLIRDMNVPIYNNRMVLRVGAMAVNHRFSYRDQLVSLSQLAAGERVDIRLVTADPLSGSIQEKQFDE